LIFVAKKLFAFVFDGVYPAVRATEFILLSTLRLRSEWQ